MLDPLWANIPLELKQLNQWVLWRAENVKGRIKPTRIPYSAVHGNKADITLSSDLSNYDECVKRCVADYTGIGFVFVKGGNYSGIDLDATTDPLILAEQRRIYDKLDSYTELSPSGWGVHIIVKGNNLPTGRRREGVELYSAGRYFTMTGKVINPVRPIANRERELIEIFSSFKPINPTAEFIDGKETQADQAILDMATRATNGEKFVALWRANWQGGYPSQSEADQALVNILAYYTTSNEQLTRLFHASALGQRPKAHRADYVARMLRLARDRDVASVEVDLALPLPPPRSAEVILPTEPPLPSANPYTVPPGLLGDIAHFIYDAAPRPVPEIALAGAIAFLAGVVGRAYNVSGTGLNQYVLLLAPTGTGKEAMAEGISKIFNALRLTIPSAQQFIGPGEIASGQALLKFLSKSTPCFLSIIGEFGYKMQQLASPQANSAELMLKRVLLDLYNKSGSGSVLNASVYSQKENNTDTVRSPAVTLLGESTRKTFYEAVDERMITDGLLPRFLCIDYNGPRPTLREGFNLVSVPTDLNNRIANLFERVLKIMSVDGSTVNVALNPDAKILADQFDKYADTQINGSNSEATRQLWNRAHIKLLKLAALVAVGRDINMPTASVEDIVWARSLVVHDIENLLGKFDRGEMGRDADMGESVQTQDLKRAISSYVNNDGSYVDKYGVDERMLKVGIIPHNYLNQRLYQIASFRKDRMGPGAALKRAIQTLIDNGDISVVGSAFMFTSFNSTSKAYVIRNVNAFQ